MIALIVVAALVQTPPAETVWTWTLYADSQPVVLAHEAPDTANLRTTLECDPGSSVAQLTLYGRPALSGMTRITAGDASAVSEAASSRAGASRFAIRTDHPVFAAFTVDGRMAVSAGDLRRPVEVAPNHLAKLRRFAELCSG